jgi:hypothetical protein
MGRSGVKTTREVPVTVLPSTVSAAVTTGRRGSGSAYAAGQGSAAATCTAAVAGDDDRAAVADGIAGTTSGAGDGERDRSADGAGTGAETVVDRTGSALRTAPSLLHAVTAEATASSSTPVRLRRVTGRR